MLFKISYMSQIHLLNSVNSLTFEELVDFIYGRFKDLPKTIVLTYFDSDQD